MERLDVSVVMPCRNEATSIVSCVRRAQTAIRLAGVSGEVVVVDNGSTDGSGALARAAGARVVEEPRPGYGSAYLAGLAAARGEAILMGDADGTYDFGELPRFLARFDEGADFVLGSRLHGRILPGAMPWHHRWIGNPMLTGVLNLLFGTRISDAHCGLRLIRRSALTKLGLEATGMEFASEMILKAAAAGLELAEVPIVYAPRPRGSASKLRSVPDGLRHLLLMARLAPAGAYYLPAALVAVAGFVLVVGGSGDPVELAGAVLLAGAGVGADTARRRPREPGRPLATGLRFAVALAAIAAASAVLDGPRPQSLASDDGRLAVALFALAVAAVVQVLRVVAQPRRTPPER